MWGVELIQDLSPDQLPEPFTKAEHAFSTFNAAWKWLGDLEVIRDPSDLTLAAGLRPVRAPFRRA